MLILSPFIRILPTLTLFRFGSDFSLHNFHFWIRFEASCLIFPYSESLVDLSVKVFTPETGKLLFLLNLKTSSLFFGFVGEANLGGNYAIGLSSIIVLWTSLVLFGMIYGLLTTLRILSWLCAFLKSVTFVWVVYGMTMGFFAKIWVRGEKLFLWRLLFSETCIGVMESGGLPLWTGWEYSPMPIEISGLMMAVVYLRACCFLAKVELILFISWKFGVNYDLGSIVVADSVIYFFNFRSDMFLF